MPGGYKLQAGVTQINKRALCGKKATRSSAGSQVRYLRVGRGLDERAWTSQLDEQLHHVVNVHLG